MGQRHSKQQHRSSEVDKYQKSIRSFKPDSDFFKYNDRSDVVVIGLFGSTGDGKSSLINSMLSVVKESKTLYTRMHVGSPDVQRGATRFRTRTELTNFISVVDNKGLDQIGQEPNVLLEVKAQLEGRRGYSADVNPGLKNADVGGDRIHIAILVVSGNAGPEDNIEKWREFVQEVQDWQGIPPLAVVTHNDVVSKKSMRTTINQLYGIGIGEGAVFTLANATMRRREMRNRDKLAILELLETCTLNAGSVVKHWCQRAFFKGQQRSRDDHTRRMITQQRREEQEEEQEPNHFNVIQEYSTAIRVILPKRVTKKFSTRSSTSSFSC